MTTPRTICAACGIGRHADCLRPGTCSCTVCIERTRPERPPATSRHTGSPPKGTGSKLRKRPHVGSTMTTAEADHIADMVCELIARLLDKTNQPPEILLK